MMINPAMTEVSIPAATPAQIIGLRSLFCVLLKNASMMPTIREASSVSRRVMRRAAIDSAIVGACVYDAINHD